MAAKKAVRKTTRRKAPERRAAPRRERRSQTKAKSSIGSKILGNIKVGEAALFGVLGYEMGNVFNGTGIPAYLRNHYPGFNNMIINSPAANAGDLINKMVGAAAGIDVLYDGYKGKINANDLSVKLPYTIGTVFDKNKLKGSSSSGERW